jgi:hypothetical protein
VLGTEEYINCSRLPPNWDRGDAALCSPPVRASRVITAFHPIGFRVSRLHRHVTLDVATRIGNLAECAPKFALGSATLVDSLSHYNPFISTHVEVVIPRYPSAVPYEILVLRVAVAQGFLMRGTGLRPVS